MGEQTSIATESQEYRDFVDKFKPKKTTDDCYTPENVYEAVLDWVVKEYGIDRGDVVRPFWPGGDYQAIDYPDGCVVVDNPPFSIITKICNWYNAHGVSFFLFAPYLTNFGPSGVTHVVTDADVRYANGAVVNTAFVTNLDGEYEVVSAPELNAAIVAADRRNRAEDVKSHPKYSYPADVLTATSVGRLSKLGIDYKLRKSDCMKIRKLDSQDAIGKAIFGGGYLLSERAAAERAAAERAAAERAAAEREHRIVWELTERERAPKGPRRGGVTMAEIIVPLAPDLYTDQELAELLESSEVITRCRDCENYHCDLVEWCSKFRHRTNANGYCPWPNDRPVR